MDTGQIVSASSGAQPPLRRFGFVHNPELRPVLEQAYIDSQQAFEQGHYELALPTSCGILEAIVTDALEHKGLDALTAAGIPAGKIADWPFEQRLTVAEGAGLIRSGCARLPAIARGNTATSPRPNSASDSDKGVSERDARLASQVLRVVMRDLDPGR